MKLWTEFTSILPVNDINLIDSVLSLPRIRYAQTNSGVLHSGEIDAAVLRLFGSWMEVDKGRGRYKSGLRSGHRY